MLCICAAICFTGCQHHILSDNKGPIAVWVPIILSALAFALSIITLAYDRNAEKKAANKAIIQALQGEKESVIYIAHMAASPEWKGLVDETEFRSQLLTALCVAWPMQNSDRARAAIFKALRELTREGAESEGCHEHKQAVTKVLETLRQSFVEYQNKFHDDGIARDIADVTDLATQLGIQLVPPASSDPELPPGTYLVRPDDA